MTHPSLAKPAVGGLHVNPDSKSFVLIGAVNFALRENKARTAIKNAPGYQDSAPVTNPQFLSNKNNELQRAKSGSSIPLNVFGGYRWPNAPQLDRHTWANVIRREIGGVS